MHKVHVIHGDAEALVGAIQGRHARQVEQVVHLGWPKGASHAHGTRPRSKSTHTTIRGVGAKQLRNRRGGGEEGAPTYLAGGQGRVRLHLTQQVPQDAGGDHAAVTRVKLLKQLQ